MAKGLAQTLSLIGDATPRVVMSDQDDPGLRKWFDLVIPPTSDGFPYLRKLAALEATGASEVLFIDADSLVFGRLDPIFDFCQGHTIAVQGRLRRTGHWYGHLEDLLPKMGLAEIGQFNGGMIYYERTQNTPVLMSAIRDAATRYEETGLDSFRGQVPDEPCVALGMARTGIGLLIPDEMDFMNTPVGLVGRLHLDVLRNECLFLKRTDRMRLIRPSIFHAGKYVNNLSYWRQLSKLDWLERYEERHPYGYMSLVHKLRRSVERRLLKLTGRL